MEKKTSELIKDLRKSKRLTQAQLADLLNVSDKAVSKWENDEGMPISNLSKGKHVIDAMAEIGYDAMTIGNHEFDFGMDNLKALRDTGSVPMVSNNVLENGAELFDRSLEITKDGVTLGVVGTTTPETATKTHPNNIQDVIFKAPFDEVKKDVEALDLKGVDLIVVLAHLGVDPETPLEWSGDYLAAELADLNLATPIIVIDGHSHTEFENGEFFGDNVLYVQTGEYLNNIGHIEVDLDAFVNSTAKLVPIASVTAGTTTILAAEIAAKDEFDTIGNVVLIDDLPYDFTSAREIVRTREAALGNLITDAMMAYGKGFSQQPDLAVINGGGIRADLAKGVVTVGDVIAVLPFGNMYSSIEVTGQQILDMFEYSYRSVSEVDADGNTVLGASGGFLHVSGAVVVYNIAKEPGSRIESVHFDTPDGMVPLDVNKTYVLATNDFLAVGGDGYTMLGGPRIEGAGLDEVFTEFLVDRFDFIDWPAYENQTPRTRILQIEIKAETMTNLDAMVLDAIAKVDSNNYTDASLVDLKAAIASAQTYLALDVSLQTEDDHQAHIEALTKAVNALVLKEGAVVEEELPATGHIGLLYPGLSLVGLGALTTLISKRKED